MPMSAPSHLSWLCSKIIQTNPKTILDIGVGFGSKGMLFREYTDVRLGRMFNPETIIDGVEIFEDYITDLQKKIYDHIYIGDIRELVDGLGFYELIYMGDVIEHMPKEDGMELLENLKQRARYVIIVTPARVSKQGAVYGNENETHVSEWAPIDFPGFDVIQLGNSLIAVWEKPEVYYCDGMSFYGERMERVFGFREYSGNEDERVLFMGLYFDEDYEVYKKHIGQKVVFWNGSDVARLLNKPEWIEILKEHPGIHVCHNKQLQDELKSVGIDAMIEPIFFAYVSDYKESFKKGNTLEVYINAHPGRLEEYGVDKAIEAVKGMGGVKLYIYGVDGEDRNNVHFMGWLDEEEADEKMSKHHVCLRLNEHDGLSQLVIKAGLWGHHIVSKHDVGGGRVVSTPEELRQEIEALRGVEEPNTETREWLRTLGLNRFSWL